MPRSLLKPCPHTDLTGRVCGTPPRIKRPGGFCSVHASETRAAALALRDAPSLPGTASWSESPSVQAWSEYTPDEDVSFAPTDEDLSLERFPSLVAHPLSSPEFSAAAALSARTHLLLANGALGRTDPQQLWYDHAHGRDTTLGWNGRLYDVAPGGRWYSHGTSPEVKDLLACLDGEEVTITEVDPLRHEYVVISGRLTSVVTSDTPYGKLRRPAIELASGADRILSTDAILAIETRRRRKTTIRFSAPGASEVLARRFPG